MTPSETFASIRAMLHASDHLHGKPYANWSLFGDVVRCACGATWELGPVIKPRMVEVPW